MKDQNTVILLHTETKKKNAKKHRPALVKSTQHIQLWYNTVKNEIFMEFHGLSWHWKTRKNILDEAWTLPNEQNKVKSQKVSKKKVLFLNHQIFLIKIMQINVHLPPLHLQVGGLLVRKYWVIEGFPIIHFIFKSL